MAKLKEDGGKKVDIYDGYYIGIYDNKYVYFFTSSSELYLPDSTPIRVELDKEKIPGEILICENFELTIAVDKYLGQEVSIAYLYCEPWELLIELGNRLKEIENTAISRNIDLVKRVLFKASEIALSGKETINKGQGTAIKLSMKNDVTFIWGPPGTGKTYTLAQIAIKCIENNERVLIISHSNVAVDGAIERIVKNLEERLLEKLFFKNIIRYGYPRDESIKKNPYINSFELATAELIKEDKKLGEKKLELEEKRKEINETIKFGGISQREKAELLKEKIKIEKKLRKIRAEIRECEVKIVSNAQLVATTISKAQRDPAVYMRYFDVVLLDEASMAYIPQSVYAASLARRRVVYIGDFYQLPPIALSEGELSNKWLQRNIFEFTKVKECVEKGTFHPWMVLLNEQRRMDPAISGFINANIYKSLLSDHPCVISNKPFDEILTLHNLRFLPSICFRDAGSRYNILSALFTVQLALNLLKEEFKSIGIITPYVEQSRLINTMLFDMHKSRSISCATVHKFQGSEREIIIFDCVDSFRQRRPGVPLISNENDNAKRLINVAVSRAKKQLITIAHIGYWKNKVLDDTHILTKYLGYLEEKANNIKEKELIKLILSNEDNEDDEDKGLKWFSPDDAESTIIFSEAIKKDFLSANKQITMILPNGKVSFLLYLAKLIKQVQEKIKITVLAENIHDLPDSLKDFAIYYPFAWAPITFIDDEIMWYGYPVTEMRFVEHQLIARFTGENTVKQLLSKIKVETLRHGFGTKENSLASYIGSYIRCPICHSPMALRKNRKNHKPFLACTKYPSCTFTSNLDKTIVQNYLQQNDIRCDKCGAPLKARLSQYGVFIGCEGYPLCKKIVKIFEL